MCRGMCRGHLRVFLSAAWGMCTAVGDLMSARKFARAFGPVNAPAAVPANGVGELACFELVGGRQRCIEGGVRAHTHIHMTVHAV